MIFSTIVFRAFLPEKLRILLYSSLLLGVIGGCDAPLPKSIGDLSSAEAPNDADPQGGVEASDLDLFDLSATRDADMSGSSPKDMGDGDAGDIEDMGDLGDLGDISIDQSIPDAEPDMMLSPECGPCIEDAECASGAQCIALSDMVDSRLCLTICTSPTETSDECPEGSACVRLHETLSVCTTPEVMFCGVCYDPDGDGYGLGDACLNSGDDCDQDNSRTHPGVDADRCDGRDNDCDGFIDEDFIPRRCGVGVCQAESVCEEDGETVCEPGTPAERDELCDGLDEDCDGAIDEEYTPVSCGQGVCAAQSQCVEGQEEACVPLDAASGLDDSCDGIDQDCDGQLDEGFTTSESCGVGACRALGTCVAGSEQCEPLMPLAEADLSCDGVDDDCDGLVDEGCQANLLSLRYNPSRSTAETLAVEVIYEQRLSPLTQPERYQPRMLQIGLTLPAGVTLTQPAEAESQFIPGSVGEKEITILPISNSEDTTAILIHISSLTHTDRILPASPAGSVEGEGETGEGGATTRDGRLVTLLLNINDISPPWRFAWRPSSTLMAPAEALEIISLASIADITP